MKTSPKINSWIRNQSPKATYFKLAVFDSDVSYTKSQVSQAKKLFNVMEIVFSESTTPSTVQEITKKFPNLPFSKIKFD